MAQKERELISERTRAALAAAKARGTVHRLMLEIADIRDDGVSTLQGMAQELTARSVPTPRRGAVWMHTTVRGCWRGPVPLLREAPTPGPCSIELMLASHAAAS